MVDHDLVHLRVETAPAQPHPAIADRRPFDLPADAEIHLTDHAIA
jgi:hypothetical protein